MPQPRNKLRHKWSASRVAFLAAITAVLTAGITCTTTTTTDPTDKITADTTVASLSIAAGDTTTVENNAEITVTGDATLDGTLSAATGRITLIVDGDLKINGTIRANDSTITDLPGDTAFADQVAGIHIVIGTGTVTFGENAVLETTGHVVVTDDADVLMSTPNELFNEVEDVSGDEFATLVPLPPDNDAFNDNGAAKTIRREPRQGAAGGPVNITGTWPPPGMANRRAGRCRIHDPELAPAIRSSANSRSCCLVWPSTCLLQTLAYFPQRLAHGRLGEHQQS